MPTLYLRNREKKNKSTTSIETIFQKSEMDEQMSTYPNNNNIWLERGTICEV